MTDKQSKYSKYCGSKKDAAGPWEGQQVEQAHCRQIKGLNNVTSTTSLFQYTENYLL